MEIILGRLITMLSSLAKPFVEKWSREHGKIKHYVLSWSISFIHRELNEFNEIISKDLKESKSIKQANMIMYSLVIAFRNTTDIPVMLKNIEFEFSGGSENIKK